MKPKEIFICISALSMQFCQTTDSQVKQEEGEACAEENKITFSLRPADGLQPDPAGFVLPGDQERGRDYTVVAPDLNNNRRFEIVLCIDADTDPPTAIPLDASLEVFSVLEGPFPNVIEAQGLAQTLFEEDSSQLSVKLNADRVFLGARYQIHLRGIPTEAHPAAASALGILLNPNGVATANYPYVLVGNLELGSSFADDQRCQFGALNRSSLRVGSVSFDFIFCARTGGGQTWHYKVIEVNVTDNSASVPETLRGQAQRLTEEDLPNPVVSSHHNWCDQFSIAVGDTQYRFLKKGSRGCSAPPPLDSVGFGTYLAVKYGDRDWELQTLSCGHFLQCETGEQGGGGGRPVPGPGGGGVGRPTPPGPGGGRPVPPRRGLPAGKGNP